jgi:putative FmdB family regulatory protein
MPRYDFKCRTCGITFEAITPVGTNDLPCIQCVNTHPVVIEHIADRQLCFPAQIHIH